MNPAVTDLNNASFEARRLSALESFGILDTAPEPGFDDIALLASQICNTPVSLVSLVDKDRQWFKATVGFDGCETPLSQSVCAQAIRQPDTFIIPDLSQDPRTQGNTLVSGDPHIRFYAGALLKTDDGVAIGTLCVIDTAPRPEGLTQNQVTSLEALARQVMANMQLRRFFAAQAEIMAARLKLEEAAREQQEFLNDEIAHRLKNILSIVHAIASQTLRGMADPTGVGDALLKRIRALGEAHTILQRGQTGSAGMRALVQSAVAPMNYSDQPRFAIAGPDFRVNEKAALMLVLMLHELSTNAMKYGALSTANGSVAISWQVAENAIDPVVSFTWQEQGGPAVVKPELTGFGTRLIERVLAGTIGGTAVLDYAPEGLICHLQGPLSGFSGQDAEANLDGYAVEEKLKTVA